MSALAVGSYEFLAPGQIVFGWGRRGELGPLAATLGRRAFLITGSRTLSSSGVTADLLASLASNQVEAIELAQVATEPTIEDVDDAAARIRGHKPRAGDLVIGIGGGSAIDMAKAVAAMATNTHGASVRDFLEGVGRGLKLQARPLPVIALPTTAGTGAEATKNAVISVDNPAVKKSLRDNGMLPAAVIVDPELTVSLPASVTAATGMDAITQLIESFISRKARPIPQALANDGLRLALSAIEPAVFEPDAREPREAMAQAALLSGMALANSGLGMAHGVAAALGVHCGLSHGLACAIMLPIALRTNREVSCKQLAHLSHAALLAGDVPARAAVEALIDRIDDLCARIRVPRKLSEVGVRAEQIPDLVRDSRGNSMDGNPRPLSDRELAEILHAHL